MAVTRTAQQPPAPRLARRLALTIATALWLAGCAAPPAKLAPAPPFAARVLPEGASGFTDKPGWATKTYAVAAANPLATEAGSQMLRAGGSAVDAAISVQMVLTLVAVSYTHLTLPTN